MKNSKRATTAYDSRKRDIITGRTLDDIRATPMTATDFHKQPRGPYHFDWWVGVKRV
jgi:hypothetical protein